MTEKIEQQVETLLSCFEKLAKINVNEHAEKKGKFTYLSWAWAVDALRKAEPTATWEVIRFNGLPFLKTEAGFFVEVAVCVQGITLSQLHPVLDNNNRPIATPNAFQINTSIQRCLVKAIALHGLGLYIYAGEDLPEGEGAEDKDNTKSEPTRNAFGLSKEGDLASGKDMQETQIEENKKLAQRLIAKINGMGSASELAGWLEEKAVISAYAKLDKYLPEKFAEVKKAELAMFEKLDPND